ncbi:hypothetical protein AB6896_07415 [Rahnella inusitata]|uniref:hypothetical protein n=1 Tax=Rahnella inusitata TaxID=58169 RepID=UPI0039BE0956
MSDKNYALIKDGFVVNVVAWNGDEDIFSDFTTEEITDAFAASIGDAYVNGILYTRPRDGYEYTFSTENLEWALTTESAAEKSEADAITSLETAQSEYTRASDKITALQQQIDDEDYSGKETAATVAAVKTTWTTYRKALRAYIAADAGTAALPKAPTL